MTDSNKWIDNGSVTRTHDSAFRIISRSVNGSNTITQTYDNDGLLSSAGAMTITRNTGNGYITATALGSATTAFAYNTLGEVDTYSAKYGTSTLFNTIYTRDALGRITRKVETVTGVSTTYDYQYDTAGRLTGVLKNGAQVSSYIYDNNGNCISATVDGTTTQGYYDLQDRLMTYGNNSYTYSASGDLSSKTINGQTTSYVYDALGNLASVTMPDGTLIEYVIDGLNRRVGKKVNGFLTQAWLYQDGLKPIAELDGAGNVVARFVYGATGISPDYIVKGGVSYRIICDHLGSPLLVINTATGIITQQIEYDVWGKITADSNPSFQPFGFAGGIYDLQTKLTWYGFRDYDPETGRLLTKDPMLFRGSGMNIYAYAGSDPINYRDVAGLRIDWNGMSLSNPNVSSNLNNLNEAIINQGKNDNEFTIKVTGGDRYRDADGNIRSSTNDQIIPNSASNSQHLTGNGATAVDIKLKNVSEDEFDRALGDTDFDPSRTRNYPDGHKHIEVPKGNTGMIPYVSADTWGGPFPCP